MENFSGIIRQSKIVETIVLDRGGCHEVTIDFDNTPDNLARAIRAMIAEIQSLQRSVKWLEEMVEYMEEKNRR